MSRTKKRTLVSGIVVFQLAVFFAVGYFAVNAWAWKAQALDAIGSNGANDALGDYRKGKRRLLEVKIIESDAHEYSGHSYSLYEKIPANRRDGPFEVWFVVIPSSYFSEQAAAYIRGYNKPMRIRLEKPEWFTPDGERKLPERKIPKSQTSGEPDNV